MCGAPRMPKLHRNAPAFCVHCIGNDFPTGHAVFIKQSTFSSKGAAIAGDHGGFSEDQASAGALCVILGHQLIGNVRAPSAGAGKCCHQNAIRQSERADGQG